MRNTVRSGAGKVEKVRRRMSNKHQNGNLKRCMEDGVEEEGVKSKDKKKKVGKGLGCEGRSTSTSCTIVMEEGTGWGDRAGWGRCGGCGGWTRWGRWVGWEDGAC